VKAFAFVSGLGGESIREWDDDLVDNAWWAAVAADDNGVSDGALLCTFNTVNERTADCVFRDTNGRTWDEFTVYSQNPSTMEEHLEAMRVKKEKREKCPSPFIELTISNSGDDVHEDEHGELHCDSKVITIGKGPAALRFGDVPLKKGAKIQHAYLQVYGDVTDQVTPHFVISGSSRNSPLEKSGSPFSNLMCDKPAAANQLRQFRRDGGFGTKATTQVIWEKEDEGWERHTVWISPDLKDIVTELINQPNWEQGSDIILQLQGKGNRAFYSADKGPCFAPTLAIELAQDC